MIDLMQHTIEAQIVTSSRPAQDTNLTRVANRRRTVINASEVKTQIIATTDGPRSSWDMACMPP